MQQTITAAAITVGPMAATTRWQRELAAAQRLAVSARKLIATHL